MGLTHLLGARRKFVIEGVRYREVTGESLARALSPRGRGSKLYDVTFPDGTQLRIEATPRRRFADIIGSGIVDSCRCAQPALRPGMRAIILECGTGAAGAWAAHLVGSAGAVVALDRDEHSIQYASRRYPLPNISWERGGIEALQGETEGAFDAALAIEALAPDDDAVLIIRELWRILAPGGVMVVAAPHEPDPNNPRMALTPDQLAAIIESALRSGDRPEQVSIFRRAQLTVAIARRRPEE